MYPTPWLRAGCHLVTTVAFAVAVTACGGGASSASAASGGTASALKAASSKGDPAANAAAIADASRLADQASFGANEALLQDIRSAGPAQWIASQMALDVSRYTRGGTDAVHKTTAADFCAASRLGASCWRDYYSHEPLANDFFRNAINNPDQLGVSD